MRPQLRRRHLSGSRELRCVACSEALAFLFRKDRPLALGFPTLVMRVLARAPGVQASRFTRSLVDLRSRRVESRSVSGSAGLPSEIRACSGSRHAAAAGGASEGCLYSLNRRKQVRGLDLQCVRQLHDHVQCRVPATALDRADVGAVESRVMSKGFL